MRKILSPTMTGVEWPRPGRGIFQRRFSVSDQVVGGSAASGAAPFWDGPRQWGQSVAVAVVRRARKRRGRMGEGSTDFEKMGNDE